MKKKIFVILFCICLIFAFLLKPFISYSYDYYGKEYISDMLNDSVNNGEISQECYEDLKKQYDENLTKAEMTDKLKENLFFFAVGQYANISQDVVADALLELADIWDYIFWDSNTQSFGFDRSTGDYIKNGLDDVIHTTPSDTIGYWVPLPVTVNYNSRIRLIRHSDTFTGQAYITTTAVYNGNYHYLVAYKGEQISGYTYWVQWTGDFTCGSFYQGSLDSGYYSDIAGALMSSSSFTGVYDSPSSALADFFGNEISNEPVLHDAVIVNEEPIFPSLSPIGALQPNYKTIVTNNYNNTLPYPPNSGLNINYYDYDYNYEVPFWEGQVLETLEYPEEIEFPSIEFETIAIDENVDSALETLDGGWLVRFFLVAILLLVLGLIL